jgi:carbon monoxide dehydrogenase subunit G
VADITRTRTIAAKRQAVWDVLDDFGGISDWVDNVDHSCILEGGAGASRGEPVGSTRRIQTGRNTIVERIFQHDPPTTLAYDIEGLPSRLRTVRNRWDLSPQGDDATVVSLTTTIEIGPRPPQRLVERIACRIASKQSDRMLAGLARQLEGSTEEQRHG